jgi:3-hydroxybutyryl-CoA dehydrogenase
VRVVVVGAGTMGAGIAQLVAMAGDEAIATDLTSEQLDRARAGIEQSLARFVKAGRLTEGEAAEAGRRVTLSPDLSAALERAEVVIEAVPEILELKHEILATVVEQAPPDCLLGTNTSQISITALAAPLGEHAARLVGTHFFNPPVMMALVEIVAGLQTRPEEVERARGFASHLGKETVICRKDSPGFITSRAYSALRLECVRMLEEGVASAEDIDKALRLGFNFPLGPLELGDRNGIDVFLQALEGLAEAHGDRFRPTVGLRNMVAAGRLGRKADAGFYDYAEDR